MVEYNLFGSMINKLRAHPRKIIFPEGSRCPDGKIHDAMPGIGLILSKLASVPVQPVRIEGEGYFSACMQHETDHLDGKLYTDVQIRPIKD